MLNDSLCVVSPKDGVNRVQINEYIIVDYGKINIFLLNAHRNNRSIGKASIYLDG